MLGKWSAIDLVNALDWLISWLSLGKVTYDGAVSRILMGTAYICNRDQSLISCTASDTILRGYR